MRTPKLALITCLAGALVASPSAVSAAAPSSAGPTASTAAVRSMPSVPSVPQLVKVRAGHHPGFDRVVWQFRGGVPAHRQATFVRDLLGDASGNPVRIAGRSLIQVTMHDANAHNTSNRRPTAARRVVPGLPNVMEVVQSGDFEATVTYGVGLAKKQPFRLFTLQHPSRVVLDVETSYPRVSRPVSLLNLRNLNQGRQPYNKKVTRSIPTSGPSALVHQIFAGPTGAEKRAGLRTVRSGATDFSGFKISHGGVARLRLRGGCDSGGSTYTIANLVMPTLRRLPSVDFVKIYDPSGHTEHPTGRRDSIPTCLEP